MKKVILIVLIVLTLCACDATYESPQEVQIDLYVQRIYDKEANVYCWVYSQIMFEGGAGGISCLPASETALRPPE